jgi:hypothetical protein
MGHKDEILPVYQHMMAGRCSGDIAYLLPRVRQQQPLKYCRMAGDGTHRECAQASTVGGRYLLRKRRTSCVWEQHSTYIHGERDTKMVLMLAMRGREVTLVPFKGLHFLGVMTHKLFAELAVGIGRRL